MKNYLAQKVYLYLCSEKSAELINPFEIFETVTAVSDFNFIIFIIYYFQVAMLMADEMVLLLLFTTNYEEDTIYF